MKTLLLALAAVFCFGLVSTASARDYHHRRHWDRRHYSERVYIYNRPYYPAAYYYGGPRYYYYDGPRYYRPYYRPYYHRRPAVAVSFRL